MSEKYSPQNHDAANSLVNEHETLREELPTKSIEQAWVVLGSEATSNIPVNAYDSHEGLLVRRAESGSLVAAADTETARRQLVEGGFSRAEGGVPYTGAQAEKRYSRDGGGRQMTEIATNLAAIDKGLRRIESSQMSQEQKDELEQIGVFTNGDAGFMFAHDGALRLSHDNEVINPYSEEGRARLDAIGTYSEVVVVPIPGNPKEGYEAVIVTDENGSVYLTPNSEALGDYLHARNFTKQENPTDFDADTLETFNTGYALRNMAGKAYDRRAWWNDDEHKKRIRTTVVDITK